MPGQTDPSESRLTDVEALEAALGLFLGRLDAVGEDLAEWLISIPPPGQV